MLGALEVRSKLDESQLKDVVFHVLTLILPS